MLALTILLLALPAVPANDGQAAQIAHLLEERCAACHSDSSDNPKARKKWDGALDLAATAADPKLVIPGAPDDSELFLVIDFDDMPPEDSDSAPFDDAQKVLLREWIAEGAQVPPPAVDPAATSSTLEAPAKKKKESQNAFLRWLGHFHPLLVHFPLGLLSAAFLAELLGKLRPRWNLEGAAEFCLGLGALSALPSVALGLLLAESTSHRGFELDSHQWLGISTALLSIVAWWASRRWPSKRFFLLLGIAGLVGITGHTGGILSYGADWLQPPF